MGKFDDLYNGTYDMQDERRIGLETGTADAARKGRILSALGIFLQIASAAAMFAAACICSARDGADTLVFDSERGMPLPPEPYGKISAILFAVIAVGFLLTVTGLLYRGKKLSVIAAVIFGAFTAGISAFFASTFYATASVLPVFSFTVEDGGDCDILYADFPIVHVCQVYLIHDDGRAYHVEGCSSKGGIQRHYTASYNNTTLLPAYDVAITGDGGFRCELVYTYVKEDFPWSFDV